MGLVARSMLSDMVVRKPTDAERTFIRDSWTKSYRCNRPEMVLPIVWNRGHRAIAERLVETARVIVAEHREVPGEIWAWLCGDADLVHFAFTKEDYRGIGLCSLLMSATQWDRRVFSTHDTRGAAVVRNHLRRQGKSLYYDPWRLACSTQTE